MTGGVRGGGGCGGEEGRRRAGRRGGRKAERRGRTQREERKGGHEWPKSKEQSIISRVILYNVAKPFKQYRVNMADNSPCYFWVGGL